MKNSVPNWVRQTKPGDFLVCVEKNNDPFTDENSRHLVVGNVYCVEQCLVVQHSKIYRGQPYFTLKEFTHLGITRFKEPRGFLWFRFKPAQKLPTVLTVEGVIKNTSDIERIMFEKDMEGEYV